MHENQFAYPDSGRQHGSAEPMMVNLYSAISAERVVFNSDWNRVSFLQGARDFLDRMPDAVPDDLITRLNDKSVVIPVPIDDDLYIQRQSPLNLQVPHLLWNHRWEYDKAPERLLLLLQALSRAGQPFRLSVVGEQFRKQPDVFRQIKSRFKGHIEHWGYLDDRHAYNRLLATADVAVSTALHDFQGLALLEAMASGCLALAPDRLAYPEYVPDDQLYSSHINNAGQEAESAVARLQTMLRAPAGVSPPRLWSASKLKNRYQSALEAMLA
jgi:glycosyltransferase involved in cell wall biosynthesis